MRILPRPLMQVLGDAMSTLARTWRVMTPTAIFAFIPSSVLTVLIFQWTGAIDVVEAVLRDPGYVQAIPEADYNRVLRSLATAVFLSAIVQGIATVFVFLFANRVARSSMIGEGMTAAEARKHAAVRMVSGITAGLLGAMTVGGALVLGLMAWAFLINQPAFAGQSFLASTFLVVTVAPALWLAVSMSMYTSVVSFEEAGVSGSLRRSIDLVRGRWGATFGFLLMVGVLGALAIQLIQLVALPLSFVEQSGVSTWVVALAGVAAQGVISAAIGATYAHWYIDLRARKEPVLVGQL